MPARILNLLMGVSAFCAILVTGLVVYREITVRGLLSDPLEVERTGIPSEPLAGWEQLAAAGRSAGPERAPVTIIVFSDFQCPACRALATRLRFLQLQYPGETRVIFRHFPLSIHPYATQAAEASECAGSQGRFHAFHDALFADQAVIGEVPWGYFAGTAGLPDPEGFERCLREPPMGQVEFDMTTGREMGIRSTPTLLVNGLLLEGAPSLDVLEDLFLRFAHGARGGSATSVTNSNPVLPSSPTS